MRAVVRPEWTFGELVVNACKIYLGHGVESAGRRNRLFRQWAKLVGRDRAIAELDHFIQDVGGMHEAAERMRIPPSTVKGLRKDFGGAAKDPVVAVQGPALRSGEVLSGEATTYTVIREIGKGGMGRVYLAERPDATRVALKLLSSDRFIVGHTERARFVREAEIASEHQHQNVVSAFELLEHRGLLVTVLELLPGENLYDRLDEGRPNLATAIRWMREVAAGVAVLHERDIVHRDISAKNVLIRTSGTLAVSDFGVARRVDDPTLTVASQQFGSLIYISPQQRQSPHEASFADDVFSLGQLFFHIATGTNPHNAGALSHHEHDLDDRFVSLIESMRHPDRRKRPHNATDVVTRIDRLANTKK